MKLRICQRCSDRHMRNNAGAALGYFYLVDCLRGHLKKGLYFCTTKGIDVKLKEAAPEWCPYNLEHLLESTREQTWLDKLGDWWAYWTNDY